MSLFWNILLKGIPAGGVLGMTSFFYATRHVEFVPLSPLDPILLSKYHKNYNPSGNPTIHDLHVRRVPVSQIDPVLLQNKQKLLERYCGGVWAGLGFSIQRILLTCFHRTPATAQQLWSPSELLEAKYDPGTTIVDHFNVLQKSESSILIRGGDIVSNQGLRPLDALMEISVEMKAEEEVVEFGFKTLFFQGLGKAEGSLMPVPVIWLHEQYAKAMLESGVRHILK